MIEIFDPTGRALLQELLHKHPNWHAFLEPGQFFAERYKTVHPRLNIPSEHPTIDTPLTIELGGTFQIYWHEGYFCDFFGITDPLAFLDRFFSEEILCAVCWREGKKVSGGPVLGEEWKEWVSDFDRIQLRSWRGSLDRDILMS